MPQNAINNLMGNRDKIRQLMSMDASGELDKIAKNAREGGLLEGTEDGANFNMSSDKPTQPRGLGSVVVNEQVMAGHSNMPRAVLESFKTNPGKEAPLPSGFGGSVLDGIDIPVQRNPNKPQVVKENVHQPIVQQTQSPQIDYSLLKTIINEAVQENVKKYISALSKKLITEGVGNNMGSELKAIKLGNSFSFINENGDVYTCSIKKKYNINEQMQK